MQNERTPDLTAHKPLDVWALGPHEEPPQGARVVQSLTGVTLAFRPAKGEQDNERAGTQRLQ